MDDDQPLAQSTAGVDYRQVSFLLLAATALVVAALLAPGLVADPGDDQSPGDSGDEAIGEAGDAPEDDSDSFDWTDLLEWLGLLDEEETGPPDAPACTVYVHGDPTPGDEQTVTIEYQGEPLADAQVWFEDRAVGTTDDRGQVTGEVPYVEELTVRVETDDEVECLAVESGPTITLEESGTAAETAHSGLVASTNPPSGATTTGVVAQAGQQNATVEYAVDGDVELAVEGVPDPGTNLTLEATIDGVPMAAADVTVDGEKTGETDDEGRETVRVPDDGTERLEVGVSRGDFTGETTLEVRLLEARLTPEGFAPIPGSDGAVVAERAGEPVPTADVAIDGEDVGETDAAGTTPVTIPLDPTAPVTVRTGDQTAQTTLLEAYGLTALLAILVVGGVAGGTYRTHGARGPVATVAVTAGLLAVLVVEAFYGPLAGLVALSALVAGGLAVAVSRSDRTPAVDPSAQAERGRSLGARLLAWTLAAASRLEALFERFGQTSRAIAVRLVSLVRSVRTVPRSAVAWLASLPGRLVAVASPPVSARTLLAAAGSLALVSVAGYAVGGARGGLMALLAGTAAVVAGIVFHNRSRSSGGLGRDDSSASDGRDESDVVAGENRRASSDDPRPVAIVWRAFARQVAPAQWRTRAPTEIERRAIDSGYPPGPVGDLTSLFRAVEYGSKRETGADRERAEEAFEAIVDGREVERSDDSDGVGDDGGDGSDGAGNDGRDGGVGDTDHLEHATTDRPSGDGSTRADDERTRRSDGSTRGDRR
ncbi:DUF4129 domain-containing protein [Natrarchaeobaculum aegyptiacum]|uniref:Protein-glutamine gamma-glutamyltransferase-like C-terminal domain-containing protein n=1 Tax=Natrarchaeobaculum aegyptiacum TaxID=745377 RepID=A0A2Z2HUS1_9EURY|nr:DUF4129 domain-containing protein [Natrarchaeobaculum aegyptiacum]ARS89267.1 hypothetical protein B1756_05580 [Natrarchaeobaculum aegyptiacum]